MKQLVIDANIVFAAIRSRDSETRRKLLVTEFTLDLFLC